MSTWKIIANNNGKDGVFIDKGIENISSLEIIAANNGGNGVSIHTESLKKIESLDIDAHHNKKYGVNFHSDQDLRNILQIDDSVDMVEVKELLLKILKEPQEKHNELLHNSFLSNLDSGTAIIDRIIRLIIDYTPEGLLNILPFLNQHQ